MTIAKTSRRIQYAGNGSVQAFSFPYRFFADSDLDVFITTNATGVQVQKTLTTDYTVSNNGDETGGTVTMVTAPASGETLTILGDIPLTQGTDYTDNDPFPATAHEAALDRLTLQVQELEEKLSRAIKVQESDDISTLPSAVDRASKFAAYDASGNPIAASATPPTASVSTFMETLLDDTTADAGRKTLGAAAVSRVPMVTDTLRALNSTAAAMQRFILTAQGTGAGNVMQGFVEDPYLGELYSMHVTGSPEKTVINKYEGNGKRTQTGHRYNSTPTDEVGHQGLDICWDKDGNRYFWSSANISDADYEDKVRRFQISDGAGTELTISSSALYTLFSGSGNGYVTPCVSLDGRWLVAENSAGGVATTIRVFDLHELMEGGAGDYSSDYIYEFTTKDVNGTTLPLQDMACDGAYIYIVAGDSDTANENTLLVYSLDGVLVREFDDIVIGETEALGDDTGTDAYEPEGLNWLWHNGRPMLALLNASGDSGSRVNRIWIFGGQMSVVGYGAGDRPSFISNGTNDLGAHVDQVLRLGHYDPEGGTWTDRFVTEVDGKQTHGAVNTGTWTATIRDAAGGGNASPTTATGRFTRIGNLMFIHASFTNIDITGMTGANNAYIHGAALSPATSNFTLTPIAQMALGGVVYGSDINIGGTTYQIVPSVEASGHIVIREQIDAATNSIMNVSQLSGADLNISGVFMVS